MTDLPTPALQVQSSTPNPTQDAPVVSGISSSMKEIEPGGNQTEGLQDATGQEFELPKEVSSAGVKMHPTVIPLPPSVSQMGVKPAGQNIPTQTTSTVVLPLSDEQIAIGLHRGITDSVRWLAEWCVKRLKQLHIAVVTVHGKLVRKTI